MNLQQIATWYNLNERQAKLALGYVETGVLAKAARRAELSYDQAKSLLHENTRFQGCVNALMNTLLIDDKVKARAILRDMLESDETPPTLKFNAAKELWNRADGEPLKRVLERKEVVVSLDDMAAQIARLSKELNIGHGNPPIEAVAVRVAPEEIRGSDQVQPDMALQPRSGEGAD